MSGILSLAEVKSDLRRIRAAAGDPEAAHGMEDALHQRVLEAIAKGLIRGENARAIAAEALKSEDIPFERWCA